ncbi:MAG TPA: hypothetical protein VHR55_01570 [Candidatus Limnocylindria bacterium]|nr:hypothetical protein [Candidatus Limnocylindria bacterium]
MLLPLSPAADIMFQRPWKSAVNSRGMDRRAKAAAVLFSMAMMLSSSAFFAAGLATEARGAEYFLPSEDAPVETEFDANDAEVQFYANRHGVSLWRAVEVSNWLEDVAPLVTDLPTLSDVFADVRIVHGGSTKGSDLAVGDVRIEVSVTDPMDADFVTVRHQMESLRAGSRHVEVVVHEVPRTLAELDELATLALAREPDGGSFEVDYLISTGEVALRPVESSGTRVWMNSCTNVTGGSLDGGRYIELDNDQLGGCQREARCTSGFPLRFAATYGVATAGHCLDLNGANYAASSTGFVSNYQSRDADLFYVHQPTVRYASTNAYWHDGPGTTDDDDAGYLRRNDASVSYPGRIWKWDTGEWRNITGYELTWAAVGMTVCNAASPAAVNGASTYCGEVTDNITNAWGDDVGYTRWTEVDYDQGLYHKGYSGGPGSSGGTMFYGGQVYGTQSASDVDCTDDDGYVCSPAQFYRVREFYWAMEAVTNDIQFICYNAVFCGFS